MHGFNAEPVGDRGLRVWRDPSVVARIAEDETPATDADGGGPDAARDDAAGAESGGGDAAAATAGERRVSMFGSWGLGTRGGEGAAGAELKEKKDLFMSFADETTRDAWLDALRLHCAWACTHPGERRAALRGDALRGEAAAQAARANPFTMLGARLGRMSVAVTRGGKGGY